MKIKKDYILREIAGQNIIVPIGQAGLDCRGIMTLKGIGVYIFGLLSQNRSREELIEKILGEYEVDRKTAESDLDEFITRLNGLGLLEQ